MTGRKGGKGAGRKWTRSEENAKGRSRHKTSRQIAPDKDLNGSTKVDVRIGGGDVADG